MHYFIIRTPFHGAAHGTPSIIWHGDSLEQAEDAFDAAMEDDANEFCFLEIAGRRVLRYRDER